MPGTAERFWLLFQGAAKSHGTHAVPTGDGVKREIRSTARTVKEPITEDHWRLHLAGTRPLGVVPIMEDDCCRWAAIDIDDYTTDAAVLATQLKALNVPALVCKSKSGGAHVYLFFAEPVLAKLVNPRMHDLAVMLSHGQSEIFPKQTVFPRGEDEHGNWLNMPYLGGEGSSRFCVRADGRGMTAEMFLATAESARLTAEELHALPLHRQVDEDIFKSGPPCLQHLATVGFQPGSRNNGLSALGVFAKKAYPDHWQAQLRNWNQTLFDPPLNPSEVDSVIAGLQKKNYNYRCRESPIKQHCDSTICQTRQFGVGDGNAQDIELFVSMEIQETDPKRYLITLQSGHVVKVIVSQLTNMHLFKDALIEQTRQTLPSVSKVSWEKTLKRLLDTATTIEVSEDVKTLGRFKEILDTYVVNRMRATTRDEILLGHAYRDEDSHRVLFTLAGLEKEMRIAKFETGESGAGVRIWVAEKLRTLGGSPKQTRIKGTNRNVWHVSDALFSWEVPVLDLPPLDESPL